MYRLKVNELAHAVSSNNIKRNLKNLQIHLLELKFDVSDPIDSIHFLTEFRNTAFELK